MYHLCTTLVQQQGVFPTMNPSFTITGTTPPEEIQKIPEKPFKGVGRDIPDKPRQAFQK